MKLTILPFRSTLFFIVLTGISVLVLSCKENIEVEVDPIIYTGPVVDITDTSAVTGVRVIYPNMNLILYADIIVLENGSNSGMRIVGAAGKDGEYTCTITGLKPKTSYRIYARVAKLAGKFYAEFYFGSSISFWTN